MQSLSTITRPQWIVIITLELVGVLLFCGVIPWLLLSMSSTAPAVADSTPIIIVAEDGSSTETQSSTKVAQATATPTRTRTPTPTTTPTIVATITPTTEPTAMPTETPVPAIPISTKLSPSAFADLAANPRAMLTNKTTFFTSACYGDGINPLQDKDFMAPADWSGSPDRKCIFGYNINPIDHLPQNRYSAGGGPDAQPRFYVIPPEAFAKDQTSLKALTTVQLIDDPENGCAALGSIGVTADGANYQCSACDFFRPGGVCPSMTTSRSIVLPTSRNIVFDAKDNGGAFGFQGYPLVIFRKGFSLYFTGNAGYAPPRTWFENAVDTFARNVDVKTTTEMSQAEVQAVATQFDRTLANVEPKTKLAALEREAHTTTQNPILVLSKQQGEINFSTTPGAVLSSISWRITPQSFTDSNRFLESNFCLIVNGEESCFTGVEDFAHCAFYNPCITGYTHLTPSDHSAYVSTRYFPAGMAPVIRDGKITARFQAPDTGATLEMDVKIRVRDVDPNLASR
ncbi:MAG: hypothetical protein HZB51_33265 [Chloroflexi bacterium]|nr:hypothetical protein [Chloroflexota bacterium]